MRNRKAKSRSLLTNDPLWYKDTVIYEVHVRAFQDTNGDGIGDIRGVVHKIDYLQDLGITALWRHTFSVIRGCFKPNKNNPLVKHTRLGVELLEDRITPSAGFREQYMLELINRMRENPAAELPILLNSTDSNVNSALAYFNVNRTVLQNQWNTLVAAPALAWNDSLATAAYNHSAAMLAADLQSHQLPGEPGFGTRISNAGYANWSNVGENIYAYANSVFEAHAAFAIDWGATSTGIQSPPGHRMNLMDANFRDIGIGMVVDSSNTNDVGPLLFTQDFGNRFNYGNAFLVGSVYNDANTNGHYDQGEGLGNVTVSVSGSGNFSTTTTAYGGYQVQLPPGTYVVTASGGSLPAPVIRNVTIGSSNVHLNFVQGSVPPLSASLPFADDFARANSSLLGAYWTVAQGTLSVASDALVASATGASVALVNGISAGDVVIQANVTLGVNRNVGLIARYQANGSYYLGVMLPDAAGTTLTPAVFKYINKGFTQISQGPAIAASSGTMRFEVVGTSLKLFFGSDVSNLRLAAFGFDSAISSAGGAGVRALEGAMTDDFSVDAAGPPVLATLPFTDAFTPSVGGQLARNWMERQGNFTNASGAMQGADPGPSVAILNGIAAPEVSVQADIVLTPNTGAGLIARCQANGNYYMANVMADATGSSFMATLFLYKTGVGFQQIGNSATVSTGSGTIRFEVVGPSLKLFLGSSLVTFGLDRTLTNGSVGMRAYRNASFDNFSVSPVALTSPSLPFSDTFTVADGSQLSRNWTELQGNVSVIGGVLRGMNPGAAIATVNGTALVDVALQADVFVGPNRGAGLVARYQANGNYYLGTVLPDAAGTLTPSIFKYTVNGFVQIAAGAKITASAGTLRFEAVGTSLKLFFGSSAANLLLVAYGYDGAFATAGAAGVRIIQGAGVDHFTVDAIVPTAPTAPFTDSFTQADGSQLARDWTERQGNLAAAGNSLRGNDEAASLATVNGIISANVDVQADFTIGAGGGAGLIARYQANGNFYFGVLLADATGTILTPYLFKYVVGSGFIQIAAGASIAGQGGTLRLAVAGSTQRLYFGGSLVASANDMSISAAGWTGIRASYRAIIDNFSVS